MSQIGIALSALGVVLAFMGLFPGITGIITGQGIGIFQFTAVLTGFGLLNLGALIYVKFTIYAAQASNLAQQVGIRLALTGLVLAGMAGFADVLGFGSHGITQASETFFWRGAGAAGDCLFPDFGGGRLDLCGFWRATP